MDLIHQVPEAEDVDEDDEDFAALPPLPEMMPIDGRQPKWTLCQQQGWWKHQHQLWSINYLRSAEVSTTLRPGVCCDLDADVYCRTAMYRCSRWNKYDLNCSCKS